MTLKRWLTTPETNSRVSTQTHACNEGRLMAVVPGKLQNTDQNSKPHTYFTSNEYAKSIVPLSIFNNHFCEDQHQDMLTRHAHT